MECLKCETNTLLDSMDEGLIIVSKQRGKICYVSKPAVSLIKGEGGSSDETTLEASDLDAQNFKPTKISAEENPPS